MESELTFSAQFTTHSNVELIFLLEEFHLQIQFVFLNIIFSSNSKKFHLSLPAIMTNIFLKFHNCFYVGIFIFLQNPTFRSSYFSPRQKLYKATQQFSCYGQSNSSKTIVNTAKRSVLLLLTINHNLA